MSECVADTGSVRVIVTKLVEHLLRPVPSLFGQRCVLEVGGNHHEPAREIGVETGGFLFQNQWCGIAEKLRLDIVGRGGEVGIGRFRRFGEPARPSFRGFDRLEALSIGRKVPVIVLLMVEQRVGFFVGIAGYFGGSEQFFSCCRRLRRPGVLGVGQLIGHPVGIHGFLVGRGQFRLNKLGPRAKFFMI